MNPQTVEEARAFVKHVESLFMPWNVEGIVAGFTEVFRGRSARQKGYRLRKELRALMDDKIANTWEGEWEDGRTGARMSGRGVEVWAMRDGKIAVWEAAFNFKEAGKASAMGIA